MRIILVGKSSFIARAVVEAANRDGLDTVALPHECDLSGLTAGDTLINFALAPDYRSGPYGEDTDWDLRVARAADRAGARLLMLSTRRVYGADSRWNAKETSPSLGDETAYGRNKVESEMRIQNILGGRTAILRLSNVFGFEYDPAGERKTFLAQLLSNLKRDDTIYFDMHPDTRRDFIPVEICAKAILISARERLDGIYNLGCGFPVRCGEIADWVRVGFGGGALVVDPPVIRDEFFLNTEKWQKRHGTLIDSQGLQAYCTDLGRRLKCVES